MVVVVSSCNVMPPSERVAEARQVLETLQPAMRADGGGAEIVSVTAGTVKIRLLGSCTCCPSASLTLSRGIEPALKSRLTWVTEVVRVNELSPSDRQ